MKLGRTWQLQKSHVNQFWKLRGDIKKTNWLSMLISLLCITALTWRISALL